MTYLLCGLDTITHITIMDPSGNHREMKTGSRGGMVVRVAESAKVGFVFGAASPPHNVTWVARGTTECRSRCGKHA
jgi:hypothetical protein